MGVLPPCLVNLCLYKKTLTSTSIGGNWTLFWLAHFSANRSSLNNSLISLSSSFFLCEKSNDKYISTALWGRSKRGNGELNAKPESTINNFFAVWSNGSFLQADETEI